MQTGKSAISIAFTRRQAWLVLLVLILCSSCYYPNPQATDQWDQSHDTLDSIAFASQHHYSHNFNFLFVGDSLPLLRHIPLPRQPFTTTDSLFVYNGNRLVVADIVFVPEDPVDSVWIQVARDQYTIGWVHESTLLPHAVPDDSISLFIHIFSNRHLWYFAGTLLLLLILYLVRRMKRKRFRMVHFDDIGSCYPTLLCILLSGAATLYASMQQFVPQTWTEFYFHPTLNPFGLPLILGLFVACIWFIILLSIATIDDVFRQLNTSEALLYLFSLLGMCCVCYLFFSIATLYFIGYPVWIVYTVWSMWHYFRHSRCPYTCGNCGAKIRQKGKCPRCGIDNY